MIKANTIRTAVLLLFVPAVLALCAGSAAAGVMLDYDTYISPWPSAIPATLNGADGVTKHPDADFTQHWGYVRYEADNSFVPEGTELWVIASGDKQVVGEVDMTSPGGYNFAEFGATYGIYGDWEDSSTVDEGAAPLENLIVLAKIDGKYYQSYFSSGLLVGGYQLLPPSQRQNDILVTDTILPEPAALALMAAGGFGLLLRRRR